MLTFSECESRFRPGRTNKLQNNTYLVRLDNDTFAVRLYQTDVVTIYRDGCYTLRTGGWRTKMTKDRINEYGPIRVYQKQRGWYYGDGIPFPPTLVYSVVEKRVVG